MNQRRYFDVLRLILSTLTRMLSFALPPGISQLVDQALSLS